MERKNILILGLLCSTIYVNAYELKYSIDNKFLDRSLTVNSENINTNIDISGLAKGAHTVYFQIKNDNNVTSKVYRKIFVINEDKIDKEIHYSIDDKGLKNTKSNNNGSFDIDISSYSDGAHTLYIKSVDDNNISSKIYRKIFVKNEKAVQGYIPIISKVNYSIDVNSTDKNITSGSDINISNITDGNHTIYMKATNEFGVESSLYQKSFSISSSYSKELINGWNLTALPNKESSSDLNISSVEIIWNYDNNIWYAYSPLEDISSAIEQAGITSLNNIDNTKGYWVKTLATSSVSFNNGENENILNYTSLPTGWSLLSSVDINETDDEFVGKDIKIVWSYSDNKWYAYSENNVTKELINNSATIESMQSIKKEDAFWLLK